MAYPIGFAAERIDDFELSVMVSTKICKAVVLMMLYIDNMGIRSFGDQDNFLLGDRTKC